MKTAKLFIRIVIGLSISMSYAQMSVKDSDSNMLMQVNDEGIIGSITLPATDIAMGTQTNKLYNLNGFLIWNGTVLGTSGSAGGWTDSGSAIYTTTLTDKVGIGDSSPTHTLDVAGKLGINDHQIMYLPDQSVYSGTLIIGSGGSSLAHTAGNEGRGNTAVAASALNSITSGAYNTAVGNEALNDNNTGNDNTAVGHYSLLVNTDGSGNTAVGKSAQYLNESGAGNTAVGSYAQLTNESGNNNTMIGSYAGYNTSAAITGSVFLGHKAGYNETENDRLYIENTDSSTPLIGGDFSSDEIYLNGKVGIGTDSPEFRLSVLNDGGILAKGTFGAGSTLTTSGGGARLMWYPRKAAFRAGDPLGSNWDNASIGDYSLATGYASKASGQYSTALGFYTEASGLGSTAMGSNTIASGEFSTAIGANSSATGDYAIAIGTGTRAGSYEMLAIGQYNIGTGSADTWETGDPIFEIGVGSGPSDRVNALEVLKSGNVGIGVRPLSGKLEVEGNVRISNGNCIITNGSYLDDGQTLNVPDYVFEPGYEIESIDAHAQFMWQHKHLPAVTSADEIKSSKSGYNMSERREQILEELEKAHIYIEQLHRQLAVQKEDIEYLRNRINMISNE
ncbi:hypothetical protein JW948_10415 [bacterium]|nr:hypothetical protein [bacterium]